MLLLFCDLDHLKQINDSYGHREGDLALVRMADALEGTFRDSDILARLGGDEFAVLAPEASDQSLKTLLARLSRNLDKANEGESRYDLSVSVGYARFEPKRPMPLADLIAEADRIMYQSRANLEFGPRATLAPKNR
jgi:two-component system cell cycle response regulator